MINPQREEGYYWVLPPWGEKWVVGYYRSTEDPWGMVIGWSWALPGDIDDYEDDYFNYINEERLYML